MCEAHNIFSVTPGNTYKIKYRGLELGFAVWEGEEGCVRSYRKGQQPPVQVLRWVINIFDIPQELT